MVQPQLIITIDGPTASGKSSSATALAQELGIMHLKGSSFLRAATVLCIRKGAITQGASKIASVVRNADIELLLHPGSSCSVLLDGEQVDDDLNSGEVDRVITTVSQVPEVRIMWIAWLRSLAGERSLVVDGRSMGTEVFPKAGMKFWLQARAEVRAQRRAIDYGLRDADAVLRNLVERDKQDSESAITRLLRPPDAFEIDSSELSEPQVIEVMLDSLRARGFFNSNAPG
jgi:CMP/dCMP kinase